MDNNLFTKVFKPVVVAAAGDTVIFRIEEAEDIERLRIELNNTGANALDSAAFQGSFDGTTFYTIDAAAVTAAFGTLAGGALATHFIEDIYFPIVQLIASAAAGGTTIVAKILVPRKDVI